MRAMVIRAALIGTNIVLVGAGLAQPTAQPADPRAAIQRMERSQRQPPPPGPLISVDFKGGALKDFASALRGVTSEPVNIALQGDAASIAVEPMSLRNVSVESALRAALGARAGRTQFLPDGTGTKIEFDQVQTGPSDTPIFVITRESTGPVGPTQPTQGPRETVEVLSIQRLISGNPAVSPDVILTAIDTGLGLANRENRTRPDIKFHKDSGLLLMRGAVEDVGLASEIVKRMTSDHDRQESEARQRKLMEIDRNARMRKAEVEMQVASSEVDTAQMIFDQIKKTVDMGQSSGIELAQAQSKLARAHANRETVRIEMERLKEEEQAGVGTGGDEKQARSTGAGQATAEPTLEDLQAQIKLLQAELNRRKGGDRGPAR